MKKIVLLVRVSTRYQDYEAQKKELIAYAMLHGFSFDEMIIIEDKESATKLPDEERQGLNKMYAAIGNSDNRIECVYCWELSRLSRRPASLYKIRDVLISKKIDLRTKHESFKLLNENREPDANSNIMLGFYIAMCENEINQKVERTRRIKTQKALEGKFTGGIILYGYCYDEVTKEYKVNDGEAIIIKEVFNLYETGKYGVNTLYKEMIIRGHNVKFHQIPRILTSVEYTGGIRPEYTEVQKRKKQGKDRIIHRYSRYYPPVISKEQFDKCREIATQNNTRIDKAKNIYYAHNLIRCSCGKYLVAQKLVVQYECHQKYSPQTKVECNAPDAVNINVMDGILWTLAMEKEADFILNFSQQKVAEYELQISEIETKITASTDRYYIMWQKTRKQMQKLFKLKTDAEIDMLTADAMVDTKREIETDKTSWENEIERLTRMIEESKQIKKPTPQDTMNEEVMKSAYSDWTGRELTEDQLKSKILRYNERRRREEYIEQVLLKIEDDQEKYNLIHKHIREVNVKNVKDIFRPELTVKRISVQFFEGKNRLLYYRPKTINKAESVYKILRLIKGQVLNDDNRLIEDKFKFTYIERFERKASKPKKKKAGSSENWGEVG